MPARSNSSFSCSNLTGAWPVESDGGHNFAYPSLRRRPGALCKRKGIQVAGKALTRESLSEAVQRAAGPSHFEAKTLVSQVLEEIAATLERGETVKLNGFGSFVVR
jgi:hypothetical protein